MDTWLEGLQVGLIGVLVVLAGLILLVGLIILRKSFGKGLPLQKPAAGPAEAMDMPILAFENGIQEEADNQAIVAVITASIYCMLSAEQEAPLGFVVRRIRRVA